MTCGRCGVGNAPLAETCRGCGAVLKPNRTVAREPAGTGATQSNSAGAIGWYLTALKKYAVFTGRARRKEFWYFFLFNNLILIALTILGSLFRSANGPSLFSVLAAIYAIATIVPALAVSARRLHDINLSGWFCLLVFIPLVGGIILLVLCVQDSKPAENQYGPNPKEGPDYSTTEPATAADTGNGEPSTVAAALMSPPDAGKATPDQVDSHASISSQPQAEEPKPAPMVFCTRCGASNPAEAKYCYSCGSLMFNPQHADTPKEEQSTEPAAPLMDGPKPPEEQTCVSQMVSPATGGPSNKVMAIVFLTPLAVVAFFIVFALYNSGSPSGVSSTESQSSNESADFWKKPGVKAETGSSSTTSQGNIFDEAANSSSERSLSETPVRSSTCPSGVSSDNPMVPVPKGKIILTHATLDTGYAAPFFPLNFHVSNQTSYCIAIVDVRAVLQVEAPNPSVSLKLKTTLSRLLKPGAEEDARVWIDRWTDQKGHHISDPYIQGGLQKLDVLEVWGFRPGGR